MRILDVRILNGANVFHARPVIVMRVDLEDLAEKSSADLHGFTDRLITLLPGLWEHRCSPRRPGGFIERLGRGTFLGHIIEHVALELSCLAAMPVHFGKTVYSGLPGKYDIAVRFQSEEAMRYLLAEAVALVEAVIANRSFALAPVLTRAGELRQAHALGPSTLAIIEAAEKRGIPWRRIGTGSLVQLGYGKRSHRVQTAVTDVTSLIAADLAQDKEATKRLLSDAGVRVPEGFTAVNEAEVINGLPGLRAPYVVKPKDSHHGQGVVLSLQTRDEVLAACRDIWASPKAGEALIEEYCPGNDYRVLVVGGRFVAAAERTPAHVIGDGRSSVRQLIDLANQDPRRGAGHESPLTRIETGAACERKLSQQGLEMDSVPKAGIRVLLCQTANLSTGGTARDVTDEVHASVRSLCERVARIVGLDVCGIDLIQDDLKRPVSPATRVIEVNAGPGLRMHVAPSEGQARDVGADIIEHLYPAGSSARIPIVAVTGTNGKTTVARMIHHIVLSTTGQRAALTSSEGIYIGHECIEQGDTTGPRSARLVLSDSSVDFAVLETARGGLLRGGLAYDWADVGVITNIRPDHIGQDGIEDIDDLIRIKSLVAERVREGGSVVLNAADPSVSALLERLDRHLVSKEIVYFSMDPFHPRLRAHLQAGGRGFTVSDGWLCERQGHRQTRLARIVDLPFAYSGTAEFQLANALAAAAACRSCGLDAALVGKGLRSFLPSVHNAGRATIYRVGPGFAVLDYGHNPDAIAGIGRMARAWMPAKLTGVIGLPGDRADALLRSCAQVSGAYFDELILRDDRDRRGRRVGEVPELVREEVLRTYPHLPCRIVPDPTAAIESALSRLIPGEVVVIFYDDFTEALSAVREFDPCVVDGVPKIAADARVAPTVPRGQHAENT